MTSKDSQGFGFDTGVGRLSSSLLAALISREWEGRGGEDD